MEPSQTYRGALLPQQEVTQPAEGRSSGPRPANLMQGGDEGANPHSSQRAANFEVVDSATAEVLPYRGVTTNTRRDPDTDSPVVAGPSEEKTLTRLCVFNLVKKMSKDASLAQRVEAVQNCFGDDYECSASREELLILLPRFMSKCEARYKDCKRNMHFFIKKHNSWLSRPLVTGQLKSRRVLEKSLSKGQQLRSRRKLESALREEPVSKKIKAFVNSNVDVAGNQLTPKAIKDMEIVVESCLESPAEPSAICQRIRNTRKCYTPEEALALMIDMKLTVENYNLLRSGALEREHPLYPPYYKVETVKKACYANDIQISETEASVPLQSLLQHTFERIVQSCDEAITQYCERNAVSELDCTFEGSWGFDGSSGQALYNQRFSDDGDIGGDESNLFTTTFVPLQISVRCNNDVIWMNSAPQSYRSCRPIRIQYTKENKELILSEKQQIIGQIERLEPLFAKTTSGQTIKAKSDLHLTAIDEIFFNVILDTPSQLICPYCSTTATQFNNLDEAYNKPINQDALKHGLSPLHAWIRALEFVLKLGYKVEVKKWRITAKSEEGKQVENRKKAIQAKVREDMGLLVDVVKPNSGTTNDGNTARIAFSDGNREKLAHILGLETWLLDGLHIILIVISSGLPIGHEKFGEFCKSLAYKYVSQYGWHPLTVTMHKILVHGAQVIKSVKLPIGMLSKQAAESRNKMWRNDREHHCRKISRQATTLDLFRRALVSSDPLISEISLRERQKKLNKLPLPNEVLGLLQSVHKPDSPESLVFNETGDEPSESTVHAAVNQVLSECEGLNEDDTIFINAEGEI